MISPIPFIPFMLEILLLYAAALGLLLAPFAGLAAGLTARSRGLSAWRYGALGALYSSLIILPWLHMMTRLFDRTPKRSCIISGYALLYCWWLFGQVCTLGILTGIESERPYASLFWIVFAMFVLSLTHILVQNQISRALSKTSRMILTRIAYLMPFVYIWVGHILWIFYVIREA